MIWFLFVEILCIVGHSQLDKTVFALGRWPNTIGVFPGKHCSRPCSGFVHIFYTSTSKFSFFPGVDLGRDADSRWCKVGKEQKPAHFFPPKTQQFFGLGVYPTSQKQNRPVMTIFSLKLLGVKIWTLSIFWSISKNDSKFCWQMTRNRVVNPRPSRS